MANTLLTVGLICIVAAIVGGGITLLGGSIPALTSRRVRFALFVLGLVLVGAAASANPRGKARQLLCWSTNFDRGMAELGSVTDLDMSGNLQQMQEAADRAERAHKQAYEESQNSFCPMMR